MGKIGVLPSLWEQYPPWVGGLTNLGDRKLVEVEDVATGIYAAGVDPREMEKVRYVRWGWAMPEAPYFNVYRGIVWLLKRSGGDNCVLSYRGIGSLAGASESTVKRCIPRLAVAGFKVTIDRGNGQHLQAGEKTFLNDYVQDFSPGNVWVELGPAMVAHLVKGGHIEPTPRYIKTR